MNKRFVLSVVVLFVVSMASGIRGPRAVPQRGLHPVAEPVSRPADAQGHFVYMLAAHVFIAIGVTWVYRQGRDARPWLGQGIRFGLALFVLMTLPTYLIYFAVQPMPSDVVAKQVVLDGDRDRAPGHCRGRDESRSRAA